MMQMVIKKKRLNIIPGFKIKKIFQIPGKKLNKLKAGK